MRNTLLALSLVAIVAGSVPAYAADAVLDTSAGTQAKVGTTTLEMPAIKSRRKMLFEFGALGTEVHFGWKHRLSKEEANGRFRGIPMPIMFTSIGSKGFGLGVPKREKIMMNDKQS
jgi:hypothetical protein